MEVRRGSGISFSIFYLLVLLQHFEIGIAQNDLDSVLEKWLNHVKVQKPIKCNYDNKLFRKGIGTLYNTNAKYAIRSFKCDNLHKYKEFSFKGRIKDGVLEGPGKLKMYIDINDIGYETDEDVCFNLTDFRRINVKSIVGSWKNGLLNGPAKLQLANDDIVIASFQNGIMDGVRRDFDSEGNFLAISTVKDGINMLGPSWSFVQSRLVFKADKEVEDFPIDTIGIDIVDGKVTAVTGGRCYGKLFIPNRSVEITKISYDAGDCFPLMEWKNGDEMMHKKQKLCDMFNHETLTPSKRLKKIWRHIKNATIGIGSDTPTDIVENLKTLDASSSMCLKFIDDIVLNKQSNLVTATVIGVEDVTLEIETGDVDDDGRLHGLVTINVVGGTAPTDPTMGWSINLVSGFFHHGVPVGNIYIHSSDTREIIASVSNGCLHGPVIVSGLVPILPGAPKEHYGKSKYTGVNYLGFFKNGYANGAFWQGMIGGGFLHGNIQESDHKMSGNNISYIYPDYDTMLHGTFEDKVMKSAREATLHQIGCDENGSGLPIVTKFKFNSTDQNDVKFYYESVSNVSFGGGIPDIMDPFERKHLQLGKSKVAGGGEGVFTTKDFEADGDYQLTAVYAVYRYTNEQLVYYRKGCNDNSSKTDDERRQCNKYSLNACGLIYEIPPHMDKPNVFHPSLGPKINHNFLDHNVQFNCLEHPRFGLIGGVFKPGQVSIKAGEELFAYYGYQESVFPYDNPWYFKLKKEIEDQLEVEKTGKQKAKQSKKKTILK